MREGGGGGVLLKEWTTHSLSRGLVIKLRWQMPIFLFRLLSYCNTFLKHVCLLVLVSVVAAWEAEPGRDGVASLKRWLS